jgi:predicted TIM-barrel fold metal-dependent hydrolase
MKIRSDIIDMHQHLPAEDKRGDHLLKAMDQAGVSRCLLLGLPEKVEYMASNRQITDTVQHRPERFMGAIFIDPRLGARAVEEIAQYTPYGIRFIKMIPAFGYYPDDAALFPVFQAAEDQGMAVLFHTGFITARHKDEEKAAGIFLQSRFGEPFRIDLLTRKFTGCRFILAHMGAPWYHQAFFMTKYHENVYADCSGTGKFAFEEIKGKSFAPDWDKIFWGNDGPADMYEEKLSALSEHLSANGFEDAEQKILRDNPASFIRSLGMA